jgi:hypothetical protein
VGPIPYILFIIFPAKNHIFTFSGTGHRKLSFWDRSFFLTVFYFDGSPKPTQKISSS